MFPFSTPAHQLYHIKREKCSKQLNLTCLHVFGAQLEGQRFATSLQRCECVARVSNVNLFDAVHLLRQLNSLLLWPEDKEKKNVSFRKNSKITQKKKTSNKFTDRPRLEVPRKRWK